MRPWIEHLITNAGAYNDFLKYTKEIDASLKEKMHAEMMKNAIDNARSLAAEIAVYQNLMRNVKSEYTERVTLIEQKTKGGK